MDRIAALKSFLESSPDDSFLLHALALEHIKLGNDAAAHELFTSLLERDPGYVGSYYHLGKLLERQQKIREAINVYEQGMAVARKAGDNHAYNELNGAKEELED